MSGFKQSVLPRLVHGGVMALGRSLRVSPLGAERHCELFAAHAPLIYAFWHGQQLGLLFLHRQRRDLEVLVSRSSDGQLLAQVLRRAGISCVRGSTSSGGAEALEELLLRLGAGQSIALTPDGPRGPRHSVAPGALALARWSGRPIVPVAIAFQHAWQLGSWDGFLVPRPGTRCAVGYGEPLWVGPGADLEQARLDLGQRLQSLTAGLSTDLRL